MKKLNLFLLLGLVVFACNKSPQAPSNLQAISIAHNFIELSWQDNSNNESEFIIIRNYQQFDRTLVNSFVDTAVTPDTDYRYTIRAANKFGHNDSDPIEVRTPSLPVPPLAPDSLFAICDFNSISLRWRDNAATEKRYAMTINPPDYCFDLPANADNYTHTNLEPNTTYTYTIWCKNSVGNSDSVHITATTRGKFRASWQHSMDYKIVGGERVENDMAAGYILTLFTNDSSWVAYDGPDTTCTLVVHAPVCGVVTAYDNNNNQGNASIKKCLD